MQQMTTTYCNNMETYSTMTLTDTRNNQPYRVRKMPDGKCWMIDNLKLATPGTDLTLTPADSSVSTNFVIPANPVQGPSTHSNGRCDSGGTLADGSGYLTCNGTNTQSSTNSGFVAWSNPSDPNVSNTESCVARNFIEPASTTGCGYLYNWYTATAGTGTYSMGSGANATSSVCPVGWRLSKSDGSSGSGNDLAMLNAKMNNPNATSGSTSQTTTYAQNWYHTGPFSGTLSGQYTTELHAQGFAMGGTWTSSAVASARTLYFAFDYSIVVVGSGGGGYKYYGYAVRCLI
jgi:uncharacterized protein (TIGR02145 family)